MNRRIPAWIAMAASGVLVAASALAQGENPKPAGDGTNNMAKAQAGSTDTAMSDKSTHHAGAKHLKSRHAKAKHRSTASTTSSAGTSAARGDRSMDAAMAQCASETDRKARAECARNAWESRRGTTS